MSKTSKILIAGFGGQGILFAGKALAFTGLKNGMEVSWLPSYGPEMRGGTANCSVTLSDTPIGSPIVDKPDVLVAMNLPSLEKYYNETEKGGYVIYDSSLISKEETRTDIVTKGIPATKMAADAGIPTLANMIILGKMIKDGHAEREGCVLVDENLAEILQALMDKFTFEGVDNAWLKMCYYYDHMG